MDSKADIKIVERHGIVTITLSRPEKHNALTTEMMVTLTNQFRELGLRDDARVIVLTGEGSSFCAGADMSMMQDVASRDFAANVAAAEIIYDLMEAIDTCPKPTICRVNGPAFGGGLGLVSSCDIAIATVETYFSLSEVRLGLVPAVISPFVLSKIGESKGRELFLTGERFNAEIARTIGLVHHVVAAEDLDAKTEERVAQLLLGAPGAQAEIKKLVNYVEHGNIGSRRAYTTRLIAHRRASDEGQEGMRSFIEKRRPSWQQ